MGTRLLQSLVVFVVRRFVCVFLDLRPGVLSKVSILSSVVCFCPSLRGHMPVVRRRRA